jgi:hypothetical protein
MKRTLLLAALASMALAAPGLAAEIPATLKLDEVTVNPRGAQLVRIGEVELPAGSHEVIIDTLPANIDASSVQVHGQSAGTSEIGAVDVSLKVVDPACRKCQPAQAAGSTRSRHWAVIGNVSSKRSRMRNSAARRLSG